MNRSVEDELKTLKRGAHDVNPRDAEELGIELSPQDAALNKWIQSNLTNYVKKEMATPEDPVRRLAEQDITHFPIAEDPTFWNRQGESARGQLGGTQMAQSDLAKQWENRSDSMIGRDTAQEFQDMMRQAPGMFDKESDWIKKLPPETDLYKTRGVGRRFNPQDLGFDHVLDVLREDVASGRIRPEQLNKVSMEQAVRRTYEYDQEMAKKMQETALQQQEGFPTYKEYPEGYKWVELNQPKDLPEGWKESAIVGTYYDEAGNLQRHPREKIVEDALKYEGATMGHCVGGYCPDVLEGKSKIYSLRDAKGEPHVTIEVQPSKYALRWDVVKEYMPAAEQEAKNLPNGYTDKDVSDIAMRMAKENEPPNIVQIKGKGNAKPKDAYLPFVQDFVRGGNWSDVGDLKNTNLRSIETVPERARFESAGMKLPKYVTDADHENLINEYMKLTSHPTDLDFMHKEYGFPKPDVPPDLEGMKRGGVVISNNPDTMMMELGNQKFGIGGLATVAKNAKTVAEPM